MWGANAAPLVRLPAGPPVARFRELGTPFFGGGVATHQEGKNGRESTFEFFLRCANKRLTVRGA